MSASPPVGYPVGDEGRGGAYDEKLLRELATALERASRREERLLSRLEEAIGVMREVERNQRDIQEIHGDLYGRGGLMTRVEVLEKHPTVQFGGAEGDDDGVRFSTPTLVTIGLFILSASLTGLWKIISWIIQLSQAVGR